jgi:hypothetical protein
MLPFKKVLILLFCCLALMTLYFCNSDSSTDPDPEPVTLEGEWQITEFSFKFNEYHQILIAPNNITSNLRIHNDEFWENGKIINTAFNTTFVDSGTIFDDGDSLNFRSKVFHKIFKGKIVDNGLVINKTIANQYKGTAIYRK